MGIEPTSSAWKAEVLPLNYTRNLVKKLPITCIRQKPDHLTPHLLNRRARFLHTQRPQKKGLDTKLAPVPDSLRYFIYLLDLCPVSSATQKKE